MTPVRRRVTIGESEERATARTMSTAATAKAKAESCGGTALPRNTREREAPKAAPEEMPSVYSLTKGFLNRAWSEAPETPSPAPATRARRRRGRRMPKMISRTASGRPARRLGKRGERSARPSWPGEIGYAPTASETKKTANGRRTIRIARERRPLLMEPLPAVEDL